VEHDIISKIDVFNSMVAFWPAFGLMVLLRQMPQSYREVYQLKDWPDIVHILTRLLLIPRPVFILHHGSPGI
jgi:hypothetical protein